MITSALATDGDEGERRERENTIEYLDEGDYAIEETDLRRAEDNLRKFSVVGLLENFAAFIDACTQRFGWKQHQLQHQNQTPGLGMKFDDLSDCQQQKVLAANDWDRQLMLNVEDVFSR